MTIMVVSFSPQQILFASDNFRYYLKENVVENVLSHKLEITHANFKDHIESFETNAPKIFKISKYKALMCGGDGRFLDVTEGLNSRKDIKNQIIQKLREKGKLLNAFWTCRIGSWKNGKCTLTQITYKQGEIEVTEYTKDVIGFDSFAPEMKDVFQKHVMVFYLSDLKSKIQIINEFFQEITKLYNNQAGGIPQIATLDKDGFKWITKPKPRHYANFTTYALNWMPQKIETQATSQIAWSSTDWTDLLSLTFECESTMLLLILAHCRMECQNNYMKARLLLDDVQLDDTYAFIGYHSADAIHDMYSVHSVQIKEKGSHTLKIQFAASTGTIYGHSRRLSIIKGFYKGGTT